MNQKQFTKKLIALNPAFKTNADMIWESRSYILRSLVTNDKSVLSERLSKVQYAELDADLIFPIRLNLLKILQQWEHGEFSDFQIFGACDKNRFTDPHYGQAGEYDSNCNWIPWT